MPKAEKEDERIEKYGYNPYTARTIAHPTTDVETLIHILKAALGSGILAMPIGFKYAGLILGIFGTLITALIVVHCAYILVQSAHELCFRTKRSTISFPDLAELAFSTGPEKVQKFAKPFRMIVIVALFVTYFGTCSVYTVIIAKNFQQVIEYYIEKDFNLRVLMLALLGPLIILCLIPNLKYLAPVSMAANICMACGLLITLYYLFSGLPSPSSRLYVGPDIEYYPLFFSITIFAMECIGVVLPLENNMENPLHFLGLCGVLSGGMTVVCIIYIILGFLGYLRYGDDIEGSVTLNLPITEVPAQLVKIFIGMAIFGTYALQFYVCNELLWNGVRHRFSTRACMGHYTIRSILCALAVLIAIAIPTIAPFIGLIGALCFSVLGLLAPVVIEIVTFWGQGCGKFQWKLIKNIICLIFGTFALIFGTKQSIEDIVAIY